MVRSVDVLHVALPHSLHCCGNTVIIVCRHQQMNMVGHQYE
jgi:hypothetical protein